MGCNWVTGHFGGYSPGTPLQDSLDASLEGLVGYRRLQDVSKRVQVVLEGYRLVGSNQNDGQIQLFESLQNSQSRLSCWHFYVQDEKVRCSFSSLTDSLLCGVKGLDP